MFFYNLVTCQCIGYNVIALTAEINSMFLHSRKLLQLQQVKFWSQLFERPGSRDIQLYSESTTQP